MDKNYLAYNNPAAYKIALELHYDLADYEQFNVIDGTIDFTARTWSDIPPLSIRGSSGVVFARADSHDNSNKLVQEATVAMVRQNFKQDIYSHLLLFSPRYWKISKITMLKHIREMLQKFSFNFFNNNQNISYILRVILIDIKEI